VSRNNNIRKKIVGHFKTISEHEEKIRMEIQRSCPDQNLIRKREKAIANAVAQWERLQGRLGREKP